MYSFYIPSANKLKDIQDIVDVINKKYPQDMQVITNIISNGSDLEITTTKEYLKEVIFFLKNDFLCLFKQLIDITAIDYPQNENRFTLVYNLLSLVNNIRIRVKVSIKEQEMIDSITSIFLNADWLEREVWDMFGIYFNNHPDLRRLLTDFGFDGHPLRKDFPLTGFVEIAYDQEKQKVYYKPVELMQEYRSFDYKNPWIEDNIAAETFAHVKRNADD